MSAAVILSPQTHFMGLNDSKKLSPDKRQFLSDEIKIHSISWSIGIATVKEIDDVWIVQGGEYRYLILEACSLGPFQPVAFDLVPRDLATCVVIKSLIHRLVGTAPNPLLCLQRERRYILPWAGYEGCGGIGGFFR